nr:MASE1 domain-containing protein [Vibrio sonorensis]
MFNPVNSRRKDLPVLADTRDCLRFFTLPPFQLYLASSSTYWQKLFVITALCFTYSAVCAIGVSLWIKPFNLPWIYAANAFLSALASGLLLTPFLFLLYDLLLRNKGVQKTAPHWRQKGKPSLYPCVFCTLLFAISLLAELFFRIHIESIAMLIFLLPNLYLAYQFGWRGAVLANTVNGVIFTAIHHLTHSFDSTLDLHLFISIQATVGLLLGIIISRQHLLATSLYKTNSRLERELKDKQELVSQLIHIEESTRRDIARELHDQIGQNITAIQIQSMLVKKLAPEKSLQNIAETTNQLAMQIHSSTRNILNQLRPPALDTMGLQHAVQQLARELGFNERDIVFRLNFNLVANSLDDTTRSILYRIIQELLNNVCKHSQANEISLDLIYDDMFRLEVCDNGIGLPEVWRSRGHGLTGIEERVSALGGHFYVASSSNGTRVFVSLPQKNKAPLLSKNFS